MYFTPDQLVAAQKANVETLFGLTHKAFEGVEKLVELNMQVAKTTLAETAETTKAALSVKDAQELLSLQASLLQPAAEKAAAYSRHLYDIMAGTNAEVSKVAESTMADGQKAMLAVVDNAVKNAPAGTENAVALVKSAVAAANNAFESVQKAAKQATEVAEANFQAPGRQHAGQARGLIPTRPQRPRNGPSPGSGRATRHSCLLGTFERRFPGTFRPGGDTGPPFSWGRRSRAPCHGISRPSRTAARAVPGAPGASRCVRPRSPAGATRSRRSRCPRAPAGSRHPHRAARTG